MRSFASDNNSGIHPKIIEAIALANKDHVVAYGDDPYTQKAERKFKEVFGEQAETFFVFNGTGANVLSLKSFAASYEAIICTDTAHIYTDECGAPEKHLGSKLLPLPTPQGKLTVDLVKTKLGGRGDQHHVQPKVISMTQSTELGTVYTLQEIKALADFAHEEDLILHMDGARLSNAAASLNCTLKDLTTFAGVDVLSFGGTKNGLLGGEAVVLLNPKPVGEFRFYRKQFMQLSSKTRFIAAQFEALLTDELWKKNALQANKMAQLLAREVEGLKGVKLCYPVQANGVFAQVPKHVISQLQKKFFFYVWNEPRSEVRWMTSFDTTEEDIQSFVGFLKSHLA